MNGREVTYDNLDSLSTKSDNYIEIIQPFV